MQTGQNWCATQVTVAMVDDSAATRWSLEQIICACGFVCVGSYSSSEDALRGVPETKPQLVLMDVRLPCMSGIECMRRLKAGLPELAVVIVSAATDSATLEEAAAAGAEAFLTKPFSTAQCMAILHFSARRWNRGADAGRHVAGDEQYAVPLLTEREIAVMDGLAKGLLYKEIAHELGISFSAVHKHQHNIFAKFHVNNRTEAVSRWRALVAGQG